MLEESFDFFSFFRWFLWKNPIDFTDAMLVATMLLNCAICKHVVSTDSAPKVSLSGSVAMLGSRKPRYVDSPSLSVGCPHCGTTGSSYQLQERTTSTALQHGIRLWLFTKVLCLLFPLPLVQLKRFSRSLIVSLQRDLIGFYVDGGFKYFFKTPTWGNDPIWLIFFQMGWNHPNRFYPLESEAQADGFIDPGECKGKLEFDQVCFHYATRRQLRLKLLEFWRELKVGKPLV